MTPRRTPKDTSRFLAVGWVGSLFAIVGAASCGTILGDDFTFETGPSKTTSAGTHMGTSTGPGNGGSTDSSETTASGLAGGGPGPGGNGAGGIGGAGGVGMGGTGGTGGSSTISTSGPSTVSSSTGQGGAVASSSVGAGGTSGCSQNSDCASLDTPCQTGKCMNNTCSRVNNATESMCAGGVCDGNGNCVECVSTADCNGGAGGTSSMCIGNHCT